jgi:hypothetical protein
MFCVKFWPFWWSNLLGKVAYDVSGRVGENKLLGECIVLVLAKAGNGEGSFVRTIELKRLIERDCGIGHQAFGCIFCVLSSAQVSVN